MRRLTTENRDGGAALRRKPAAVEGASELVASAVAAARYMGAEVDYGDLLADCGAAFSLRVAPNGFHHEDTLPAQWRMMAEALRAWGFDDAQVVRSPADPAQVAHDEIASDRPVGVAGCFPEAPWRGAVAVEIGEDGLWTLMATNGQLHRMAPRASVLVVLGAGRAAVRPGPLQRAMLWATAISGEGEHEGAQAWANWLNLLRADSVPEEADGRGHEYLYEVLLDARAHAAAVVGQVADETEGVVADWLRLAAGLLERLVVHLEARRPPLHAPELYENFSAPEIRRRLAEHIEQAAEIDLAARAALTNAPTAEYPPEDII